jgi:hypothetical protein
VAFVFLLLQSITFHNYPACNLLAVCSYVYVWSWRGGHAYA